MVRGFLRGVFFVASFALFGSLAQAHEPGSACDGHCQDQGNNNFAPNVPSPAFPPSYVQQQSYQQPAFPAPAGYGQGPRTFANSAGHDCPICRAEQAQGLAAGPNDFAAAPNNFDPSLDRPRLMPRNMPPRQAGYPMADPYARGMRPNMPRGFQSSLPGTPIPIDPLPVGPNRGLPIAGFAAQSTSIPDGMALVMQDDSPLMNGGDQLGSIDRDQTLRVLNIQGNWVQLETNWLGKNAWIRRNQVRMNDNIQPPNDIAPPAT